MKDAINKEGEWRTVSSEYLFNRPWLTARLDVVELPDGRINKEYYVLEYPDWVNIIAITEDGHFVMERQYRHALGITAYELPCGVMEKGETPLEAAQRELQEETGYGGGEWEEWLTAGPNPSSMNNLSHSFVARGVKKISSQQLDSTEDLTVHLLTQEQVIDLLKCDQIKQALQVGPLWKYFALNKLL